MMGALLRIELRICLPQQCGESTEAVRVDEKVLYADGILQDNETEDRKGKKKSEALLTDLVN